MRKDLNRAPSLGEIEAMARRAYGTIPEPLRRRITDVAIRVQDFPDGETMRQMALDTEFDLLGLYHGISLEHRDAAVTTEDVDMIFLYRRPILDYWCDGDEDLEDIVRHVLIHEIGHHFGFSDEAMGRIEQGAEAALEEGEQWPSNH